MDNKPFILNVYRSVSREQVENYLYRITYDLLDGRGGGAGRRA